MNVFFRSAEIPTESAAAVQGEMEELRRKKKPSISLIKLIEATGILLGIAPSFDKSKYKCPVPSNYDKTLDCISEDFYGILIRLAEIQSSGITNEVSSLLYKKTLEPGFNYENAVNDGGLAMRELFNAVVLILMNLKHDDYRLPIKCNNVMVVIDGTLSSYVAFDNGVHVFNYGTINIVPTTLSTNDDYNQAPYQRILGNGAARPENYMLTSYLRDDVIRRCKNQYKIVDWSLNIAEINGTDMNDIIVKVGDMMTQTESEILVVPMEDANLGLNSTSLLPVWAAWECRKPCLLSKTLGNLRPFPAVVCAKTYLVCVKYAADLSSIFNATSQFVKPGDKIILFSIVDNSTALGDSRDTRYSMGSRCNWVTGNLPNNKIYNKDWNSVEVRQLEQNMNEILVKGQLNGKVLVTTKSIGQSVSQRICQFGSEENADIIVLLKRKNRNIIMECARDTSSSLLVLK